nr:MULTISPECIES: GntP family permease [unclassified Roseobacter]
MTLTTILIPLGLLIWLAWRGVSVLILAPVMALLASAMAREPLLASLTQVFMPATGGFITAYFLLFLLGAVFGRIMEDSGAARRIADGIVRALGTDQAIPAVVLSCAILTYGGVSLFVVAFAVYPLAMALFRSADLPRRLIPAAIALGAFTFTMTALPGTPAIQNAIPMPYFGTTAFAAPGLGVIAALIMAGLGLLWLTTRAGRLRAQGEGFLHLTSSEDNSAPAPIRKPLRFWPAFLPIAAVLGLNLLFSTLILPALDTSYLADPRWGGTNAASVIGIWSIIAALILSILLALALFRKTLTEPSQSLSKGAEAALLPIFNTAALVGFGAVIAGLPAFEVIRDSVSALPGGALVSMAVSASILAGVTGSASGGMSIALDTLGTQYLAQGAEAGIATPLMHRVIALSTGGLDALPHNGAVITLLSIGRLTHRESYGDIFMVAVAIPLVALISVLVLGSLFGSF